MNKEVTTKLFITLLNYAREQSRCKLSGINYNKDKMIEIINKIDVFIDEILVEVNENYKQLDYYSIIKKIQEYFADINIDIDAFNKPKRPYEPSKLYTDVSSDLNKMKTTYNYGGKKTKRNHYKLNKRSRRNKRNSK
jgi:hypothetical protein